MTVSVDAILDLSAIELRDAIAARRVAARQAVQASLDRIARLDPQLRCFLELFPDRALARAAEIDAALARGEPPGSLCGVPVALKDNICLDHGRTTCGSRLLGAYESPFSATAAQRLIDAGAVVVGKTNMDEFAMGSSTENSAFGPTRNPIDPARVPGGSSGGSAAAVAARMVPLALGSDTGGSVRQPAAFCGVVGLKPTYGRVSRWGLVAYASSLDQIGPIARTVADAALCLDLISGRDPLDSTCADRAPTRAHAALNGPVENLRLGIPREARSGTNHPAMTAALERTIEAARALGATTIDIDLPNLPHGIAAYYLVATAEASSNLARFDGVRYGRRAGSTSRTSGAGVPPVSTQLSPSPTQAPGPRPEASPDPLFDLYAQSRAEGLGPEVQRRIMLGTYALSSGYYDAYYLTALKVRRLIKNDFDRAFERCDAVLMPTTIGPAFRLGEKTSDPLAMYLEDLYTVTANLAGVPAISIPAGFADEPDAPPGGGRLPLGVQLLAPVFEDERLARIARRLETER